MGEPSNVGVVRAQFDAFDAGDVDAFVAGLAEDVEFRPPGFWVGSRVFRGHDEVRESFAEVMEIRNDPNREAKTRSRRFFVDRADEAKVLVVIEITVFELDTGRLPHQLVAEILPGDLPTAVLSGPTFAAEVAKGLPSAMTVASPDETYARHLAEAISTDSFRAYLSDDMIGVEVGGATKNIYAIGAGLSDGLGFGANTRIALLTRGLAEMTRLGVAQGARRDTFMGLAGMGDLVLTCTDDQSRNRRFGLALARGMAADAAREAIGQVVEGYFAALAVHGVSAREGIDMPIAEQLYRVLYQGLNPQDAVAALMSRPLMRES